MAGITGALRVRCRPGTATSSRPAKTPANLSFMVTIASTTSALTGSRRPLIDATAGSAVGEPHPAPHRTAVRGRPRLPDRLHLRLLSNTNSTPEWQQLGIVVMIASVGALATALTLLVLAVPAISPSSIRRP